MKLRLFKKILFLFSFLLSIIIFVITTKNWQDNGVEVIIVDDIKCLNEWNMQEQLDHSNLAAITAKYSKDLRKKRHELQECNKQFCRIFLREDFGIQIIMDCRTIASIDFKRRLGLKQRDPIINDTRTVKT